MPKPRFTIAAILFLMLCVGGFLTGHRAGHQQGYLAGQSAWELMPTYYQIYYVEDLLDAKTTIGDVANEIHDRVLPICWDTQGGNCSVKPFPGNNGLVVQANEYVHQKLVEHLSSLRAEKQEPPPADSVQEPEL